MDAIKDNKKTFLSNLHYEFRTNCQDAVRYIQLADQAPDALGVAIAPDENEESIDNDIVRGTIKILVKTALDRYAHAIRVMEIMAAIDEPQDETDTEVYKAATKTLYSFIAGEGQNGV